MLSRRDLIALLDRLEPPFRLLGEPLYGPGLLLQKALSLRVKDVDQERHQITVRRGKGAHDRTALLTAWAREGLSAQIELVRRRHLAERAAGRGEDKDVRTTMIYRHIVDRGPLGVVSPLAR